MSSISSKSPSPRRNSPDSYQLAVKGLEQEKQMVAALKRLSIGHLMNHDPDLPVLDADLHLFDGENHDDSTLSGDSLSLSKTPSPQTSDSNILAHLSTKDFSELPDSYHASSSGRSVLIDQEFVDAQSDSGPEVLDADLLWVPGNLLSEVNPQQFKNHVKSTIDELLERKLSRSKSAKTSKRSSLSFSTTDEDQPTVAIGRSKSGKSHDGDNSKRFSNPSLRELSTELEALSKMAGMDSNDAVTLARSLSTSSLGYTDVEKHAFDEMNGSHHISPTSNQAELLDFGVDETSPTTRKSYVIPNKMMGLVPAFQGYPQQPQRRVSPSNALPRRMSQDSSSRLGMHPQLSTEDFSLKRSRRLDYRKGPKTTPTHLGSQLQNNKAEKLAELRQNLSGTSLPIAGSSGDLLSVLNSNRSSMLSMQSINPRSSQILFSYKSPGVSSSPRRSHSPASRESQSGAMRTARDSPYGNAARSSSASIETQLHHTKYGQQNPKHISSLGTKQRGYNTYQGETDMQQRRVSPSGAYPASYRGTHSSQVPYLLHQRKPSPRNQNAPYPYQGQPQNMYPSQNAPQQEQPYLPSNSLLLLQLKNLSGASVTAQLGMRRQFSDDRGRPFYTSRTGVSKRDKSKELNQNLDLLRNEINEFKESLSKSEPKADSADVKSKEVAPANQTKAEIGPETPDFSFDLSSHDVSYEDSLGMEQDVLKELTTKQKSSSRTTPRSSPGSSPTTSPKKVSSMTNATIMEPSEIPVQQSVFKNAPAEPSVETSTDVVSDERGMAMKDETPYLKLKIDLQDNLRERDLKSEKDETDQHIEPQQTIVDFSGMEVEESVKEPFEPVKTAPTKVESMIKKKKSFGSLANKSDSDKKKTGKKTWLWSRDRSVSATSSSEEKITSTPARSVSSPEIRSNKRELPKKEETPSKENVITKLFKKKRNSVSGERPISQTSSRSLFSDNMDSVDTADVVSRTSAKSNHSKDSKETVLELKSDTKKPMVEANNPQSKSDETVSSRIKNKFKQIGKSHEDKSEPLVDEKILEVEEESQEESKPQSTLEVQEKLKRTIRRTSKPNQPIEFTDSAFGFPLPPPSQSTLVMIDYRFPVHVERAIYRLSHLKLANPKRSLREQVLLSNFMYAYLNLVDHTLHLEQQMELEENLEQPVNGMDMFTPDEVDTEFETDDDLDEGAFDSIKLDLDVQETHKISV